MRTRTRRPRAVRRRLKRTLRRLPAPRGAAAIAALRATRTLVTGRAPAKPKPRRPAKVPPFGPRVGPPLVRPALLAPDHPRSEFPPLSAGGTVVQDMYATGRKPVSYDIDLLEALNEEYRDKPIVPHPRQIDPDAMQPAARRRVEWAHSHVDLRDKDVLEMGCGQGYEMFVVGNDYGSRAHGVDVRAYTTWDAFRGDTVEFTCGDLTVHNPFPEASFDRVISYTVWEHVVHPYALLEETYRILRPGGLAWIRANLFAGPQASHRYRDIYFPWPHLLFTDEVISAWDAKHGRTTEGSAWVNRLSWHHYQRYFAEVGFRVRHTALQECEWDQEFYERFEDVLGRYPMTDLKQDYFLAVLERPT